MMAPTTMVEALNSALREAMRRDDSVLVFGEDVSRLGGVFRVTAGLRDEFGPDRCFDTPLAESAIVGTAIGLAAEGMRPVAELQFDGFSYPAFDQIVSHLAKLHNRSAGRLKIPVTLRIPSFGRIGAVEHHGESPEAYYAHTAGLRVVAPSTVEDAYVMLLESIFLDDPVIFLEPKSLYWSKTTGEPPFDGEPLHTAVTRRVGNDITVAVYGNMVPVALAAADVAMDEGVSFEVIDLRTLAPLDEDRLIASVQKTGRCIVAHEAPRNCGLGAEIAASIQEKAFYHLEAPVLRVTGFDTPYPPPRLEKAWLPGIERILGAARESLAF